MKKRFLLLIPTLTAVHSSSAQFTITSPTSDPQTLASGTGTVTSTGSINTSGSTVAVTITGSSTLENSGTIQNTGSGRAVRLNTTGLNVTINNHTGAFIKAVGNDAIQFNTSSSVTINNSGTISVAATGGQALDLNAITSGTNIVNNSTGGVIEATDSDAVRPGVNGQIFNFGTIDSKGTTNDGLDAQNNSGVTVENNNVITAGRHGITGDQHVTVTNNASGTVTGRNGSGINIDSTDTATKTNVTNRGIIEGKYDGVSTEGDGDGVDVDGAVAIDNYGTIRALGGQGTSHPEGIAAGGGSINNYAGAIISGEVQAGNATEGRGILIDDSNEGAAPVATTIINAGTIKGFSGFAVGIIGTQNDSITNEAGGSIVGVGTKLFAASTGSGATIQTDGGDDKLANAGSIVRLAGGSNFAVDLGAGNDTMEVKGGVASITGDLDGGAGTDAFHLKMGTGNTFSYQGTITGFETVTVESGTLTPGTGGDRLIINGGSFEQSVGSTLLFDIAGTTAGEPGGYDQIVVTDGTLTLGGELDVTVSSTFGLGTVFVLLDKQSVGGIDGAFSGIAEGQIVTFDDVQFLASYHGGNGNDFTLTAIVPEPGTVTLLAFGTGIIALRSRRHCVSQRKCDRPA